MKNILFILHVPPPVHGSSVVGKSIMDSVYINESFECRYINLLVSRSVNETGKAQLIKLFRYFNILFKTLVALLKKRPDACYLALTTTGAAFYKDVLLVFLLKTFRVKLVYHLHNKGVCKSKKNVLNRLLYQYVFHNANVIVLSKLLYSDIECFVPESSVFNCANGIIEPTGFTPDWTKDESSKVKILFLSNLIESKGVFVLLEACSILLAKGYDFECNFVGAVGDINLDTFNQKLQELNLQNTVNYLGKKYDKEKWDIFNETDIFAFPTYCECFPLVLLEAMCAGIPVVSTFEGGIPEIVEDEKTGFLVPQKDSNLLADKLELLLANPPLQLKMGAAARERFQQKYTLQSFEIRMQRILKEITQK